MADINITMGLDDGQFSQGVERAKQVIQKFSSDCQQSFDQLKNKMGDLGGGAKDLGDQFEKLGVRLAAAFSVKALADMAEWANNVVSTGKAVGMTTGEIVALQAAVMQAGGTALAASRGIEMFYMKLDQARQGGLQQQVAFERIGISLKDLKDMDDRALFEKTIHALAEMPPSAERNRIEVELLSRSFRGIPLQEVAAQMDKTKGKFDEFGPVLEDAGKAYQQLQRDITNFKIAVLEVVQPLMQAFTDTKPSVDDFVTAIKTLVGLFAAWMAYNFAAKILLYGEAFLGVASAVRAAAVALKEFSVAEVMAANATGIGAVASMILKAVAAIGIFLGVETYLNSKLEENKVKNEEAADASKKKTDADGEAARQANVVYTQYARLNAAIAEQTDMFKKHIQTQIENLGLVDQTIGKGEIQKAQIQEEIKIRDEYNKKIDELNVKLKEALASRPEQEQSRTVGALKKAIADLTAQRELDVEAAGKAAAAKQSNIAADQMELLLKEDLVKINKTLADIQINIDELSMTSDQKKIANIQKQTNEYIKLAIEKRRAQLGTDMPDDQLMQDAELQKVIKGIKDKQQAVVDATQVEITASRDWSTAWGQAFAQYKEDAFNGAMEAKKVFDIATRGMEDAIVSFVKTGKFNFKDLMNTIVEELLRSQIRQLIANIFGGSTMSGAGGLLSGVGKIFGFAQGGVVGGAGPILVGESGPELFIPPTSGSIVPNNSMGNFAGSGSVTYNISAVDARSFQQLVASDPQFLYAVTEQGRLSLPSTRR